MIGKDYAEEISITFFMVMSEEKRKEDVDKKNLCRRKARKQLSWETTIKVRNEDGQNLLWERELYTPLFC